MLRFVNTIFKIRTSFVTADVEGAVWLKTFLSLTLRSIILQSSLFLMEKIKKENIENLSKREMNRYCCGKKVVFHFLNSSQCQNFALVKILAMIWSTLTKKKMFFFFVISAYVLEFSIISCKIKIKLMNNVEKSQRKSYESTKKCRWFRDCFLFCKCLHDFQKLKVAI